MTSHQVILLPRDNYFRWVEAAKEYVLKYGPNLTSDPDTAARFGAPDQIVTIINSPGAFANQGDILAWFGKNYPNVRTDVVSARTPAELRETLAKRISGDDRFGMAQKAFSLRWPTDYPVVTQAFSANPDVYRRFGMPGHEGVDIRAPLNTNVYACADGTVVRVDTYAGDPKPQPYGNSIRIQHRDGYMTVYAHLQQTLVKVGDQVKAGQRIGLSDSTGNSTGSHLHLTLKKAGATAAGLTTYPSDQIDPLPFLQFPGEPPAASYPWPAGKCLVGVHGRADGRLDEPDYSAIQAARSEAVKLTSAAAPENVDRLKQINPSMFVMVRLFADFRNRVVRSDEFAGWAEGDIAPFYGRGVRYFEIHNEPNLQVEGWQSSWQDGREFGRWFLDVLKRLKARYPEARFGFPGLSAGASISGQRMDSTAFLQQADEAARSADWIGVHAYFQNDAEMNSTLGGRGYELFRQRYPDKLLFITEFSNPAQGVDSRTKAQQYVKYYESLRRVPGVGAAFAFVVSALAYFPNEVWRREDGTLTDIPKIVGSRAFA